MVLCEESLQKMQPSMSAVFIVSFPASSWLILPLSSDLLIFYGLSFFIILSDYVTFLGDFFLSSFMTNSVRVHRNFIDVQGAHGPALPYTIDSFQLHISLWFLVGTSNCVWHANKVHSKHKFYIFSLPQLAVFLKIYLVFLYVCKCFIWKKIHKIPWNWSFRQLWATTCWCWELKLYLLQKH